MIKLRKPISFITFLTLLSLGNLTYASQSTLSKQALKMSDEMTVSGRYELPKAKAALQSTINVVDDLGYGHEAQKIIAKTLKKKPIVLNQILLKALNKSLANYEYLDVSNSLNASDVKFELSKVLFEEKEDGTLASVVLNISSEKTCLNAQTEAKFLALKIEDTQQGRKAFAFIGTIAATAAAPYSYAATNYQIFLGDQLGEAATLNKVKTYGQKTAIGEGHAHKRGPKTAKRYAFKNAIRLATARYITLIDQQCVSSY